MKTMNPAHASENKPEPMLAMPPSPKIPSVRFATPATTQVMNPVNWMTDENLKRLNLTGLGKEALVVSTVGTA